tara:strand:+ start:1039 stop:1209 length:171 start_codon:yes stop_codon:yes gene_type:complete
MKYIILALAVIAFGSSCTFNKVPVDSAGLMSGDRNVMGVEVGLLDYKVGAGVWVNK